MNSTNATIFYTVNAWLMALYPVLDIYNSFGGMPIGIGSLLLILSGILSYIAAKPKISNKETIMWIIGMSVISLFTYFTHSSEHYFSEALYWHNLIVIAYVIFIFVTSGSRLDVNLFFKVGMIIGIVASIICIYQRAMLILTGSFDAFYIPGLELGEDMDAKVHRLTRPAAFFTEPAHLSLYVIPMLYYALKSNRPFIAMILAMGALASGSTTGFLLLGLILGVFLFEGGNQKRKMLYSILFVSAGLLLIRYAPSIIQDNVIKINETESDESRLLGGILYWKYFDTFDVLFGIGLNQLSNYAMQFGIFTKNYSGALVYTFTCYGLLGIGVTVWYIVSLFRKPNSNIVSILIFLGVFCTDQILFNRNLVYLLIFTSCMQLVVVNRQNQVKSIRDGR